MKFKFFIQMNLTKIQVKRQNMKEKRGSDVRPDTRNQILDLMSAELFKNMDKLKFMISREPHTLFLLWQLLRFAEYLSEPDQWREQKLHLMNTFGDWPEMKSLLLGGDRRDICSMVSLRETYKYWLTLNSLIIIGLIQNRANSE